jgi:Ni2+-binding GTPase involved in maturation of urease and hydrogenase
MHRYNPGMRICRTNLKTGEGLGAVVDALMAEQSS